MFKSRHTAQRSHDKKCTLLRWRVYHQYSKQSSSFIIAQCTISIIAYTLHAEVLPVSTRHQSHKAPITQGTNRSLVKWPNGERRLSTYPMHQVMFVLHWVWLPRPLGGGYSPPNYCSLPLLTRLCDLLENTFTALLWKVTVLSFVKVSFVSFVLIKIRIGVQL